MCKNFWQSRYKGYFSIDAGFALVIVIFAYSSFAHLALASASIADSQSREISSSLIALRFSSFVLEEASTGAWGLGTASYSSANELDAAKLQSLDLNSVLARAEKRYAKISLKNGQGELFSASAGTADGEVFCAGRLAILSGEIVRLEACLA